VGKAGERPADAVGAACNQVARPRGPTGTRAEVEQKVRLAPQEVLGSGEYPLTRAHRARVVNDTCDDLGNWAAVDEDHGRLMRTERSGRGTTTDPASPARQGRIATVWSGSMLYTRALPERMAEW
jgi:hypothetical protein